MTGERTITFDPHVHTDASYDAEGSVHKVLACCHNSPLDAVAITDHDTTLAAREALEQQDRYDVTVVPGVEISTADGHLLALGVVDRPPIGRSLADTVRWVRTEGGVAVVPHPFQVSRYGVRKRDLVPCDGIEVFNAWSMAGIQNRRAEAFASEREYTALGGSDAHDSTMIGQGYTEVDVTLPDGDLTPARILAGIRAGRTRAVGNTTSKTKYLSKYTRTVRDRMAKRVR
ncbi:PHP domain-containing protein [Halorientalis halophila]|uniref:PHP domain-containing protein n=1 Tax=Halorientalis halophila TaxID=3108499 RepID=UPI0030080A92